jgi:hypothetical protein
MSYEPGQEGTGSTTSTTSTGSVLGGSVPRGSPQAGNSGLACISSPLSPNIKQSENIGLVFVKEMDDEKSNHINCRLAEYSHDVRKCRGTL